MTLTYYQILELPEQASADDIRRAYLRLVRLTHPDRTPDPAAHRRYLLVNEAYDTLRQPVLRTRYDAQLHAGRQPARPAYTQPFGGNAYQLLRVPYSATPAQIEQAYQRWRQSLRRAPQSDPGIQRQLADLEHAYATLTDEELLRQHRDRLRHQPPKPLSTEEAFYARYAPVARLVCAALLGFALLLGLDFVWVRDYPREPVMEAVLRQVQDRRGVIDSYYQMVTPDATFRADQLYPVGTLLHLQRSAVFGQVRSYRPTDKPAAAANSYANGWFPRVIMLLGVIMGLTAAWGYRRASPPKRVCDTAATAAIIGLLVLYLLLRI